MQGEAEALGEVDWEAEPVMVLVPLGLDVLLRELVGQVLTEGLWVGLLV